MGEIPLERMFEVINVFTPSPHTIFILSSLFPDFKEPVAQDFKRIIKNSLKSHDQGFARLEDMHQLMVLGERCLKMEKGMISVKKRKKEER